MDQKMEKLISLVKYWGVIEGRSIQAVINVLQSEGIYFLKYFKFSEVGPYSLDIEVELDYLFRNKIFQKVPPRGVSYLSTYSYIEETEYYAFSNLDSDIENAKELIDLLKRLDGKSLQALSMIYYFKEDNYSKEEIEKAITHFNPSLEVKLQEAFIAYDNVKANNLVH